MPKRLSMNAKVAVIVRTMNRPVLLERALRSVLAQTMEDFALVVVNDGGDPSGVEAVLKDAGAADDARLVLVHNKPNLGRVGAIHAGLDAADSDYFVLHDDDDTWAPEFLAVTTAHLDTHPDDGAAATSTEVVFEEMDGATITEVRREWLAKDLSEASLIEMAVRNYIPPIALLVRRSVLDKTGRFDPSLPVLEDWDFNLRLLRHYPVGFVTEPLAHWHHRENATGDDSNSVTAEASDHAHYDVLLRDAYLRRDLDGSGEGLGHLLAEGYLHRKLEAHIVATNFAEDNWHHGHQDHLSEVAKMMSLEVGRLRGEVIALRDQLKDVDSTVSSLREAPPKGRFRK